MPLPLVHLLPPLSRKHQTKFMNGSTHSRKNMLTPLSMSLEISTAPHLNCPDSSSRLHVPPEKTERLINTMSPYELVAKNATTYHLLGHLIMTLLHSYLSTLQSAKDNPHTSPRGYGPKKILINY